MRNNLLGSLACVLLVGACVTPRGPATPDDLPAGLVEDARCANGNFAVDTSFDAGALQSCEIGENGTIAIMLAPEDEPPINCSPWYAFRVTPAEPARVTISLSYTACGHRYWPKVSYDGTSWHPLDQTQVEIIAVGESKSARIALASDGRPFFIAAQEIIVPSTYDAWLDQLEPHPDVERAVLGKSAEGREIPQLKIGRSSNGVSETVVLVGRQHPPEVTGALAMFPFVEAILADDELARAYRARFTTIVVPVLNPDGVVRGHWRHATGGLDLNRDWGMFTQTETKLMADLLAGIEADPARKLMLFLDFHSTQNDVVYTLSKDLETDPTGYTDAWLADYQSRLPDYEVVERPGYSAGRGVAKNWVYEEYGVPTATFELGDETDRGLVRRLGTEAARAMMQTLLETPSERRP